MVAATSQIELKDERLATCIDRLQMSLRGSILGDVLRGMNQEVDRPRVGRMIESYLTQKHPGLSITSDYFTSRIGMGLADTLCRDSAFRASFDAFVESRNTHQNPKLHLRNPTRALELDIQFTVEGALDNVVRTQAAADIARGDFPSASIRGRLMFGDHEKESLAKEILRAFIDRNDLSGTNRILARISDPYERAALACEVAIAYAIQSDESESAQFISRAKHEALGIRRKLEGDEKTSHPSNFRELLALEARIARDTEGVARILCGEPRVPYQPNWDPESNNFRR